uniref:Uncharacterized protein n=1 Tax=Anguilla anguilla TaxID=7936 RepID=A0A0E9QS21_ANGAN
MFWKGPSHYPLLFQCNVKPS